jgi:hypothetical protein
MTAVAQLLWSSSCDHQVVWDLKDGPPESVECACRSDTKTAPLSWVMWVGHWKRFGGWCRKQVQARQKLMSGCRHHCFEAHSEKYASFGKMHLGGQLFFSHVTTDSKPVQNIWTTPRQRTLTISTIYRCLQLFIVPNWILNSHWLLQ